MQEKLEYRSFLFLLIFVSISFLMLMAPFFGVIFWSVTIAIVFAPVNLFFIKRVKNKNLSSLLTLLTCTLVVVIPFLFVLNSFLIQGLNVYEDLQSGKINISHYFEQIRNAFPEIQNLLDSFGLDSDNIKTKVSETAIAISTYIARHAVSIGQGAITFFAQVGILLYVAFFIIRDSDKLINYLHLALPLGDEREALFFQKFSEVTRATIKGSLVIAIVQGVLGGLIFWFLDINAALLWAVIMTLFSLVPMIGAGIVWLPFAIYLFAIGDVFSGTVLVVFGIAVIGLVDNLLRPILVGRDTKLPDYLVLLSTLGGFILYDMNGFIIGPLVATLFITSWNIFINEFNTKNKKCDKA